MPCYRQQHSRASGGPDAAIRHSLLIQWLRHSIRPGRPPINAGLDGDVLGTVTTNAGDLPNRAGQIRAHSAGQSAPSYRGIDGPGRCKWTDVCTMVPAWESLGHCVTQLPHNLHNLREMQFANSSPIRFASPTSNKPHCRYSTSPSAVCAALTPVFSGSISSNDLFHDQRVDHLGPLAILRHTGGLGKNMLII